MRTPCPVRADPGTLDIFTDGSFNAGFHTGVHTGGWAFVVFDGARQLHSASGFGHGASNNTFEVLAVVHAVSWIAIHAPGQAVIVWTDARHVVEGCQRYRAIWRNNGWKRIDPNPRARRRLIADVLVWKQLDTLLESNPCVTIALCKGHAGNAGNERADTLAREAARLALCRPPAVTGRALAHGPSASVGSMPNRMSSAATRSGDGTGLSGGIAQSQSPYRSHPEEREFSMTTERAVLAGGCFWGMQDLIRRMPGVVSTKVGYTGGDVENATYRNHGNHAEAIEIVFDPAKISYRDLLEFFFQIHDPSTPNRQGNDLGPSYRSAIFFTSQDQKRVADDTIADVDASGIWPGKVVTEVTPASDFWDAEPEHQDYLERYPHGYTCHFPRPNWRLPKRQAVA
jgi:peptide-methionine (S)-S-oxide reductase